MSGLSGLSSGKSEGNGKMHITLCDLVSTWDSLTPTQKKSLNQRYQMGCECKVSNQAAPTCPMPHPGTGNQWFPSSLHWGYILTVPHRAGSAWHCCPELGGWMKHSWPSAPSGW